MDPLKIFREAHEKVPELRYAWGVIGVIAAATIAITLAKNDPKLAVFYFVFALAGTFLIIVLTKFVASGDQERGPAQVIVWAATLCFVAAMGLTLSAYAIGCPEGWARLVGAAPACFETKGADAGSPEVAPQPPAQTTEQQTAATQSTTPPPTPKKEVVTQRFNLEDRSDDCGVNRSKNVTLCLPGNAVVTGWDAPVTTSANCGSSIDNPQEVASKPGCVTVKVNLHGCGYDKILGIKNCKGRGWIGGYVTVKGEKTVE